jgi:TolA-binding protein
MSVNKDNEETFHQLEARLQQMEFHLQQLESQRREQEHKQEEAKRREQKIGDFGLGCGLICGAIVVGIVSSAQPFASPGLNCLMWILILMAGIGGLLIFAKSFEQ